MERTTVPGKRCEPSEKFDRWIYFLARGLWYWRAARVRLFWFSSTLVKSSLFVWPVLFIEILRLEYDRCFEFTSRHLLSSDLHLIRTRMYFLRFPLRTVRLLHALTLLHELRIRFDAGSSIPEESFELRLWMRIFVRRTEALRFDARRRCLRACTFLVLISSALYNLCIF